MGARTSPSRPARPSDAVRLRAASRARTRPCRPRCRRAPPWVRRCGPHRNPRPGCAASGKKHFRCERTPGGPYWRRLWKSSRRSPPPPSGWFRSVKILGPVVLNDWAVERVAVGATGSEHQQDAGSSADGRGKRELHGFTPSFESRFDNGCDTVSRHSRLCQEEAARTYRGAGWLLRCRTAVSRV